MIRVSAGRVISNERRGMSDAARMATLLRRVAGGDRDAFADLYDATSPAVYGVLVGMLRSSAVAEEVAQEVYVEVWRKAGSFDPKRGSAETWIALLARSRALDRIRSERSYAGAVDRSSTSMPAAELMGEDRDDPSEAASVAERRRLVRAALREMPEEQRTAILLSFFGGLSHSEIAEREEIPLGTVKSRIRAGLSKVEDRLRPVLGSEA